MDIREALAAERVELADLLDGLSAGQWETPSLAAGWTVRNVAAHLIMPFRYGKPRFVMMVLLAGGKFDRVSNRVAARDGGLPVQELADTLRRNAHHSFTPPGSGFEAPLTDLVVHGLDIRRPLGVDRVPPADVQRLALNQLVTPRAGKYFGTDLSGCRLQATDLDWTHGTGAPIVGPAIELILALAHRPAGRPQLTGAGAARLIVVAATEQ